jgi:hypothetical protein
MIHVPSQFQSVINTCYPPENHIIFEKWLEGNAIPSTERVHLPVQWTSYYVNHNYGQDRRANYDLQEYLNGLDTSKKYWTVVQYDDSILNRVDHLDILRFEMSKNIGYPIPLLCMPHSYQSDGRRKYFASFVGQKTHEIRDFVFRLTGTPLYYVSGIIHTIDHYCKIISQSMFGLCPRGYGLNSFRIVECMQYGTIPVYISDEFIEPFGIDFNEYGVKIEKKDAHRIDEILKAIPTYDIMKKQDRIKELYESHFTFEGCRTQIQKHLCSLA